MTWAELPLLRILLPFIGGILSGFYFCTEVSSQTLLWYSCACIAVIIGLLFSERKNDKLSILLNLFILFFYYLLGLITIATTDSSRSEGRIAKPGSYSALVLENPIQKGKWKRCKARVTGLSNTHGIKQKQINVLLYLAQELELEAGDELLISITKPFVKKEVVPWQFDYPDYLRKQNIHGIYYLKRSQVSLLGKSSTYDIGISLARWRAELSEFLSHSKLKERNEGLLLSLVFGFGNELDQEMKDSFSITGTLHVLSVSGMHLALIYALFFRIFKLFGLNLRLTYLLVLILIWVYAGITGFSASVLRAAVMCSLLITGELTGRLGNPVNALAGSCLVLLVVNPFSLFNPGFQLSYMAVTGIILFQPLFNKLKETRNKWMNEIRNMITVTVAAQVWTFPVSMMYFGQFPVYFLLANLVIVPFSSALLYVGILYFFFFSIGVCPGWFTAGIDIFCDLFCLAESYLSRLPAALISERFIEPITVLFLYASLVIIYLYQERVWKLVLCLSILFFMLSGIALWKQSVGERNYFYVFEHRGHPRIFVQVAGDTCTFKIERQRLLTWNGDSVLLRRNYFLIRNTLVCLNRTILTGKGMSVPGKKCDYLIIDRTYKYLKSVVTEANSVIHVGRHSGFEKSLAWSVSEQGAYKGILE